jgi:hypothetical protein
MEGEEELQNGDPDEDLVANSIDSEEYRRSF